MVSPARIKTNRLLAKAFNLNDFLDPTRLAHDELQYYNDLTRAFDKIINHYINWLDSSEAKKLFYEEIQNREEYFQTIDSDLDDIIRDTSLSADRIIEKVYRKGLSYGYKDINRLPVFNDACKYGLKATQEYNFELISNVSNDLIDSIRHHIFRGIAEGQSIHEVARAITDSGLKPIEGKTLSAYQRASLIARTEIARSMTTGRLQSYANYGVEKVKILTAGDDNVCPICRKAEKKIYTLEEASNLIPFHPACRCSIIAHIEHYTIPEKPINDPNIMNCIKSDGNNLKLSDVKNKAKEKLGMNNEDYKNLNNPRALAKHYGLSYKSNILEHIFIDKKNDCRIIINKNTTDGRNPLIDIHNKSKGTVDVGRIIKSYYETPETLKIATKEIMFLNEPSPIKGELKNALAYHTLKGKDSIINVFSKSSLIDEKYSGLSIERQLLHEMAHAVTLNPIHKLDIMKDLSQFENNGVKCSEYGFNQKGIKKQEETIAEAISIVAYKNRADKSTAKIKVPKFDKNGKHDGYEIIGYEEWHERFNDIATWLEKELGL